jgi:hypothetical protein
MLDSELDQTHGQVGTYEVTDASLVLRGRMEGHLDESTLRWKKRSLRN